MIERPIKAVLCDMYGTLLFEEGGLDYAYAQVAIQAGLDVKKFTWARNATLPDCWTGILPDGVQRARVMLQIMGLEVSEQRAHDLADAEMRARVPSVHLYPATVPTLRALRKRGYRLGLISDCTYLWRHVIRRVGLEPLFDVVTMSNEVGMTKPDPRMYLNTCQGLGVRPEECVYVGDGGSSELEGAHALNILAVLIDQEWGVGRRDDHRYYDYCISSLKELLDLLPPERSSEGPVA